MFPYCISATSSSFLSNFLFVCFMFMSSLTAIPKILQKEPKDSVIHHLPNAFRNFNITFPFHPAALAPASCIFNW